MEKEKILSVDKPLFRASPQSQQQATRGRFRHHGEIQLQRQIAHLMLTERSEKQITDTLGQSPHTTHTHVVELFRKFGVNSRAALMAMWLGQKA